MKINIILSTHTHRDTCSTHRQVVFTVAFPFSPHVDFRSYLPTLSFDVSLCSLLSGYSCCATSCLLTFMYLDRSTWTKEHHWAARVAGEYASRENTDLHLPFCLNAVLDLASSRICFR